MIIPQKYLLIKTVLYGTKCRFPIPVVFFSDQSVVLLLFSLALLAVGEKINRGIWRAVEVAKVENGFNCL